MAAPTYATDLANITLAEATTGFTALGGGASGLAIGPDLAMQGTNCVDKAVSASEKGHIYDNGTTITPGASEHFFVWLALGTPGLANTLANRGITVAIGTSTTAYNQFHVGGSDTLGATARVGRCYPIRYVTTSNGSAPFRTLVGSPGANPQWFGGLANITGTAKGSNFGVDAIRRGTGVFVTAGEVASPGTFSGMQAQNDSVSNRWGVFTGATSSIFELQGRFVIGRNTSNVATTAYFVDSNKNVLILDTPHSQTDFTQIIVDQASTVCTLTNVTFEALGTNNKGLFNAVNGTVTLTSCTFVNFGATTLNSLSTATGCVWRSCGTITQTEAALDECTFNNTLVLSNNPSDITDCQFVGDGTGHGIEISAAGTYSFVGNTFTGFGAGGTTDAALYNNSGGAVTLNISGGGGTPTVRNGAGASTTINNTISVEIVANVTLSGAEVRIYDFDNTPAGTYGTALAGTESHGSATYTYSGSGGNTIWIQIMKSGYVEFGQQYTMPGANGTLNITLIADTNA